MGDGEIAGTALEVHCAARVQVHVIKGHKIAGRALKMTNTL